MNWFLEPIKKYATFSGRARRREYWYFTLISIIISLALSFIEDLYLTNLGINATTNFSLLSTGFDLFLFLPTYAVTVRRLHDIGDSGLLAHIYMPVVYILGYTFVFFPQIFTMLSDNQAAILFVFGILWGILTIVLIIFMCINSQKGENKYGKNPKEDPY